VGKVVWQSFSSYFQARQIRYRIIVLEAITKPQTVLQVLKLKLYLYQPQTHHTVNVVVLKKIGFK